jgi:hypothetical protein
MIVSQNIRIKNTFKVKKQNIFYVERVCVITDKEFYYYEEGSKIKLNI